MVKKVKELMSTDCVTATLQDNVYELAVLMKNHDTGYIPVVEGKKLIGVVTDRDLVIRGYAEKHPGSAVVKQVMTAEVETIEPDATADDAVKLMAARQIRRLPVVDGGELVGIVTLGDLAVHDSLLAEAGHALSGISEHEHREQPHVH
ncbi:CBS domain-containing protein [Paenibacillus protaetiae]|uniref:CBS domain-containing protein n=1 Tax=Paenibacillus protaetiae TaxID=2509456 RepID=A0A4P6F533_9BACL|nr:CBS domain-containing protein [Paenibacillus protaetiae]QAY65498.1 CBS domain-containing protein [Paenibacillus protaetiae]